MPRNQSLSHLRRGSKRLRYERAFEAAAPLLMAGKRVWIPIAGDLKGGAELHTARSYWYDWRRAQALINGVNEARMRALLDARITLTADEAGVAVIELAPVEGVVYVGLGEGETPTPEAAEVMPTAAEEKATADDHLTTHTLPWQAWFRDRATPTGMLACLDLIPAALRADEACATLDDLPSPTSAEAEAFRALFAEHLAKMV